MSPLFRRKEPPSLPKQEDESPQAFCDRLIAGFSEKAHHNKRESLVFFWTVLGGTLLAPLLIGFGHLLPVLSAEVWTRMLPASISVVAAGSTAWLQLRKPQQLWSLYRDAQRRLEDERNRHRYGLGKYADDGRDRRLAEAVADIAIGVHKQWMPMVPDPEDLTLVERGPSGLNQISPGGS